MKDPDLVRHARKFVEIYDNLHKYSVQQLAKLSEGLPLNLYIQLCAYHIDHCGFTRRKQMDKLINKVEKDVKKGTKKKALKDIKVLKKADKKFDRKLDKAHIKH